MTAHLSIGTSTDRIHLTDQRGFYLRDWRPVAGGREATFAESALASYRQPVSYRDVNVVETIEIQAARTDADALVRLTQDMRRMLRKASDYWANPWQGDPVYLAARSACESNMRFAIVVDARMEQDGNPYGQPFMAREPWPATMDELTLVVERGPWTDTIPGDASECVEISGTQYGLGASVPYNLEFVNNSWVNFTAPGDTVGLDNLAATTSFTADAWVRADDWGESNKGGIFYKYPWSVVMDSSNGLYAQTFFPGADSISRIGLDDYIPDGTWHHVLATWNLPENLWYIAIDGEWVADYDLQQAGAGAPDADVLETFALGNDRNSGRSLHGGLGWARISSGHLYTIGVNFTPDERCTMPIPVASTLGLWIDEGTGATVADHTANGNDGTATNCTWATTCEISGDVFGRTATCEDEVFVANKHNKAQITSVHYWDESAGAWSANLMGSATPFAFMPPTPLQVNDCVVFGIDTATQNSGPFCSLVFDIATALNPGSGLAITWYYSRDGADVITEPWPILGASSHLQDNTNNGGLMDGDAFDTVGVNAVQWRQPSGWSAQNPTVDGGVALGTTGYWVAAVVTNAVAADATPPTQDNRDIYSVLWPCVTVASTEIDGDMPAWLKISLQSSASHYLYGDWDDLEPSVVYAGLRQASRGTDFTAYLNFADEQNSPLVTVENDSPATVGNSLYSPTGRTYSYTAGAAGETETIVTFRLTDCAQWIGRYHAFLRGYQAAGSPGDLLLRVRSATGYYSVLDQTEWKPFTFALSAAGWIDLGALSIEPRMATLPSALFLLVDLQSVVARQLYLWDLILLPTDEWAARLDWDPFVHWNREIVRLDGVTSPVKGATAEMLDVGLGGSTESPALPGLQLNRTKPFLVPNSEQKVWFHFAQEVTYHPGEYASEPEICVGVQLYRQQRYASMRGDR